LSPGTALKEKNTNSPTRLPMRPSYSFANMANRLDQGPYHGPDHHLQPCSQTLVSAPSRLAVLRTEKSHNHPSLDASKTTLEGCTHVKDTAIVRSKKKDLGRRLENT
jgi:hypothetical protein